jgi:carboxymethylenebutenolidase
MSDHEITARAVPGEGAAPPFGYLARPRGRPRAGVLVLHEAFGLNPDIEALCRRLARDGDAALACDLYWRGPDHLAGYDERPKAIDMLKSLPDAQVLADAARGLDLLEREVGGAPLGVLGLRIGGRYALLVASAERRRVSAAVSYYGAGIDGGRISPLWTIDALEGARGLAVPLLLFFVGDDPTIPADEVARIEARLREFGAVHEVVRYPGVRPGFVFPGRDTFDPAADGDAWRRTREFLARHLGGVRRSAGGAVL